MKKNVNALKLAVMVLLIAGLLAAFYFLPVNEYLGGFLKSVQAMGIWGPIVLALVYVVATIFMVPGTILTLGAGFTFGLFTGSLAVMFGSVVGAQMAFWVGRTMARDFVEQKARENPKFAAIDGAVQQNGFKIVLLTRLSPIFPFNLLNYLFSVTKVRTRDYFLASWIGMFPGTIMYVYLGTAAKNVADLVSGKVEGGPAQKILFGVGLIATVIVTVYVTRVARRAISEFVPEETDEQSGDVRSDSTEG